MSWLVYRMNKLGFSCLVSLVFSGQFPTVIFGSFAGVYADRLNAAICLLLHRRSRCWQPFLLAFLTLTGLVAVWHLIVLSIILGTVNAVDVPARQSFVVDMVENKNDLGNAIALNSLCSMAQGWWGIHCGHSYRLCRGRCLFPAQWNQFLFHNSGRSWL